MLSVCSVPNKGLGFYLLNREESVRWERKKGYFEKSLTVLQGIELYWLQLTNKHSENQTWQDKQTYWPVSVSLPSFKVDICFIKSLCLFCSFLEMYALSLEHSLNSLAEYTAGYHQSFIWVTSRYISNLALRSSKSWRLYLHKNVLSHILSQQQEKKLMLEPRKLSFLHFSKLNNFTRISVIGGGL